MTPILERAVQSAKVEGGRATLDENTRQQLAAALDFYDQNAVLTANQNWLEIIRAENVDETGKAAALRALERLDETTGQANPDFAGYYRAMLDGAGRYQAGNMKLAEIPQGSPLHAEVEASIATQVAARLATEMAAAGLTQRNGNAPAAVPPTNGVPIGGTPPIDSLTERSYADLPQATRDALIRDAAAAAR